MERMCQFGALQDGTVWWGVYWSKGLVLPLYVWAAPAA